MSRKLSNESSLENLKREAKRWLRALRENDADARERLGRSSTVAVANPTLRDVQHALALEHGFAGWAALSAEVATIEQLRLDKLRNATQDGLTSEEQQQLERARTLQNFLRAASHGDVDESAQLLDANPELLNQRGTLPGHTGERTALHFAVNAPNAYEMVHLLLERGANPNIRDEGDNAYPLHFVAEQDNVIVLTDLLDHGADLDGSGDYHELSVIGWATVFGQGTYAAARELLNRGVKHTLPSAVAMGDTEAIRDLVKRQSVRQLEVKLDSANRHRSLLHLAVVKNQSASLATLVELGADVNATDVAGLTALDQAALDGKSAMAQWLIDAGASIELPAAIALERLEDVQRLLHADIEQLRPGNKYGQLVVLASERASASVIRLLLRCRADVNARALEDAAVDNTQGYTALHAAAFHGNAEVVDVLLKAGANVRAREERYCATPAGWARHGKQHEIAARILNEDIDIFDAAEFNMAARIRDIVRRDPNAVRRRLGEYVRCVPSEGQPWKDPNKTPLDAARDWGNADAEAVLLELLENTRMAHDEIVSRFLTNACRDWRIGGGREIPMALHAASRLLKQHPELARENIFTAVVCGDVDRVRELLDADPALASRTGGPRDWPPLLYLANARLLQAEAFEHSAAIARLLLDHGADPNAYCPGGAAVTGYDENGIFYTVLTCVIGMGEPQAPAHPRARELATLLLERGAEPYDQQMLYNVFADHASRQHLSNDIVWLLELMYKHSVLLGRGDDWKDPAWNMLTVGRYGPGSYFLLQAALSMKLLSLAEWMLRHGADPDIRASDSRLAQYSLFEQAFRAEDKATQELLARYGADTSINMSMSAYESFVQSSLEGNYARATELFELHPAWRDDPRALLTATRKDNADAVKFLLGLGISPDIEENRSRARALHAASFAGATRAAAVLLEAGADPDFRELNYGATPMSVAAWTRQQGMTDVLTPYSRDLFSLVYAGKVNRVREILREDPTLALSIHPRNRESLLMWLPDNEDDAVALAELLLANGADPTFRDAQDATAADIAERRALVRVAAMLRR